MRFIVRLVVLVLVLALGFVAAIYIASEYGGEVVVLHTTQGNSEATTHLWVVDDSGFQWLRAGTPDNGWLKRIGANPEVTVERAGETQSYRAVPVRDPVVRDRIHALMREKYGAADSLISLIRDGSLSVPVRLDPVTAPAQ
jgi:hypothetical protein